MSTPIPVDLVLGATRERVVIQEITRTQIVQYAGASGDYSPLHTDEPAALRAGYRSVMAHGMLVMSASEMLLAEWVGRERLVRFGARFLSPVWPGDALTAVAIVKAVYAKAETGYVDFDVRTTNQDALVVLSGSATACVTPTGGKHG